MTAAVSECAASGGFVPQQLQRAPETILAGAEAQADGPPTEEWMREYVSGEPLPTDELYFLHKAVDDDTISSALGAAIREGGWVIPSDEVAEVLNEAVVRLARPEKRSVSMAEIVDAALAPNVLDHLRAWANVRFSGVPVQREASKPPEKPTPNNEELIDHTPCVALDLEREIAINCHRALEFYRDELAQKYQPRPLGSAATGHLNMLKAKTAHNMAFAIHHVPTEPYTLAELHSLHRAVSYLRWFGGGALKGAAYQDALDSINAQREALLQQIEKHSSEYI